jgi:hypothetical protein
MPLPDPVVWSSELTASGGSTIENADLSGGYARASISWLRHETPWPSGAFVGATLGVESWKNRHGTGYPSPHALFVIGWHLGVFEPRTEYGFDLVQVDRREEGIGFGLWVPRAGLSIGVRVKQLRVSLEAKAQYRFTLLLPDQAQFLLGLRLDWLLRP